MHRISLSFKLNEIQGKEQLKPYLEQNTDSLIQQWENSGKLEMRLIDGEKCYVNNAVPNLKVIYFNHSFQLFLLKKRWECNNRRKTKKNAKFE
jgi:hypothetical protein